MTRKSDTYGISNDKSIAYIWTNMNMVYSKPVTVAELGTSDHNMVLLKPSSKRTLDTGNMTRMSENSMGAKEKAKFELALPLIKWEPL